MFTLEDWAQHTEACNQNTEDNMADGDCKSGDSAQDVSGAGVSGMNETIPEWQLFLDASLGTRIDPALQDAPTESNVHTC